jgi:hypothetical protein
MVLPWLDPASHYGKMSGSIPTAPLFFYLNITTVVIAFTKNQKTLVCQIWYTTSVVKSALPAIVTSQVGYRSTPIFINFISSTYYRS